MSDCLLDTPKMTHSSWFSGFKMETPVGGGVQDGVGDTCIPVTDSGKNHHHIVK